MKYGAWALVTGASSGIGKELAGRLAECGLNLLLTARRGSVLQELAADVRSRYGVETRVVEADLSSHTDVLTVIDASKPLDIGTGRSRRGFWHFGPVFSVNFGARGEYAAGELPCSYGADPSF